MSIEDQNIVLETPEDAWRPPSAGTKRDLVLYLVGGIGLFIAASMLVAFFVREITLGVTMWALLLNVVFIGGSAYVFGVRRGKISWVQLGISPPRWDRRYLLLAVFVVLAMTPLRGVIGIFVQTAVQGNLDSLQGRADLLLPDVDGGLLGFLSLFIGVGILVPVSEELYFRGLLHTWFRQRMPMWGAIMASSILFGLAHFDSLAVLVSSLMMGVVIAWLFEKTRSLWLAIAIHAITNSLAVILLYLTVYLEGWLGQIPGL